MAACDFLQIFDDDFYSQTYLGKKVSKTQALTHYIRAGSMLGYKPHSLFDVDFYCQEAGIDYKTVNPLEHYLTLGNQKNLSPNPLFDPIWYIEHYDYDRQNITAFGHYIQQNKKGEYTDPNEFFDTKWYKKEYDYACGEYEFCLEHYLNAGKYLPYNPSPKFFSYAYLLTYLLPARLFVNPLAHYLSVGRKNNCAVKPVNNNDAVLRRFDYLNKIISRASMVHFHLNDKFFNPTVKFINTHFNKMEHAHLWFKSLPFEKVMQEMYTDENICQLDYSLLDVNLLKKKKLYFHSFFVPQNVQILYNFKELLDHSYWLVWGGDLYEAGQDEMNTYVRKNIYGIGSFSDNEKIKQLYGENHKFFDTNMALSPIGIDLLEQAKNSVKKDSSCVTIQINNSSDISTLEMLSYLSKFKDKNIKIKTVLSYSDTKYNSFIIEKGRELFGDKFTYLDTMVSPEEYVYYLAENDILILNQNRQQGGANACACLYLGQKVFVRNDVTTAQYLRDNQLVFFDSCTIAHLDWNRFIYLQEKDKENNRKMIAKNIYNTESFKAELQKFFADDCFYTSNA